MTPMGAKVTTTTQAVNTTEAGARLLRRFVTDERLAALNGGTLIFGGRHETPAARKLARDGLIERRGESGIAYRLTDAGCAWLATHSAAYRMMTAA